MKNLLLVTAKNTVFANIILVMVLVLGGIASLSLIREKLPEVTYDRITISVRYPGADPHEIEEGILRKIEERLEGLEGVKSFTTTAKENLGTATLYIDDGYEAQEVLNQVRNNIGLISGLPENAEKPVIMIPSRHDAVLTLYISSKQSKKVLKELAGSVRKEILKLPEISLVELNGELQYEINIEIPETTLRKYGLTLSKIAKVIRENNLNQPGGMLQTKSENIRIRTIGRKYVGEDFSNIVLLASPQGELIRLGDVAHIDDGFEDGVSEARVNGKTAILLSIYKTPIQDSLKIADAIRDYVEWKRETLPIGTEIGVLYDSSETIRAQLDVLITNGIIGMILVFFLLWLFVNTRLSTWVGAGIIVSIFGGIIVVWLVGGSLNVFSIFGFIMVLGIIADDAIIVGESIIAQREQGQPPLESSIKGTIEVGRSVIAAVSTSIVFFLPLLFVGGMLGKLIYSVPVVVIACLSLSLLESFILLPAHLSKLPDPNRQKRSSFFLIDWISSINKLTGKGLHWFCHTVYRFLLIKTIQWRYVSLCLVISLMIVSFGLIRGEVVKFKLFPTRDGNVITANIEFPEGTPSHVTERSVKKLETAFISLSQSIETPSGEPLIRNTLTFVGQAPDDEAGKTNRSAQNIGGVQVILLDSELRGIHSNDLIQRWKTEVGPLFGVQSVSFLGSSIGPSKKPIQIGVDGESMEDITTAVNKIKQSLQSYKGIYDIQSDNTPSKNELRYSLKPEAAALGLSVKDLANQIYAGYYGEEVVRVQRGNEEVKIRVRFTGDERSALTSLENFRVRTQLGYEVPLKSVADVTYGRGVSSINRSNGLKRIKISASVDESIANTDEIMNDLSKTVFSWLEKEYQSIDINLEGESKNSSDTKKALMVGFPIAIIVVFLIIATLFQSYTQPLVVLFTIPFGIIGAIFGHLVLSHDVYMLSIFGMVALSGVVVNDAIVLIEKFNMNIASGMKFLAAIENAGIRRFRAVFLTSLTTVGGLTPLILETNYHAQILIPMALTIATGIIFTTVLVLILIPNLLVILNDFRLVIYRVKDGQWSKREILEPSYDSSYHRNRKTKRKMNWQEAI